MARIEHTITIDAPIKRVFALINHPTRAAEWIVGLSEVVEVSDKAPKPGTSYRWHFKMGGVRFPGRSIYQELDPPHRIVLRGEGPIRNTTVWEMAPAFGGTILKVTADYEIPQAALVRLANQLLLERINAGNLYQSLLNLKAIAETEEHMAGLEAEEAP